MSTRVLRRGRARGAMRSAGRATRCTARAACSSQPASKWYTAFDYLVDAVALDPAPAPVAEQTWIAVIDHADSADAVEVAWRASFVGRVELIVRVFDRALSAGQYIAATEAAGCLAYAGLKVSDRGRISAEVLKAYDERS